MRTLGSAPDPYAFPLRAPTGAFGEQLDLSTYTQVATALTPGESTAIIGVYGQSNAANFVASSYTVTQSRSHQMNPLDGGVYLMKEPVLGCNGGRKGLGGTEGNWVSRLGDKLIAAGKYQRVIICNVAVGGTRSSQWARPDGSGGISGDCNQRLQAMCNRMKAAYTPTMIIRHQGESDATDGFSAAQVTANIRSEVETIRSCGVTAPVLVCNVGYFSTASVGTTAVNNVRTGQTNALSSDLGIYAGIDTDIYGASYRDAGDLHWNATGADAVATAMKNRIVAFF
jgi:hypothetical protein